MKRSRRYFTKIMTAIFAAVVAVAILIFPSMTYEYSYSTSGASSSGSSIVYASKMTPIMILKAKNATDADLDEAEAKYLAKKAEIRNKYIADGKDLGSFNVEKEFNNEVAATDEANWYFAVALSKKEKIFPQGEFTFTAENYADMNATLEENMTDFVAQMNMYRIITIVTLAVAVVVFILSVLRIIFDNTALRVVGIITSVLLFLVAAGMFAYPFFMDVTQSYSVSLGAIRGSGRFNNYCGPAVYALAYPVAGLIAMIFGICSCRKYKKS